MEKLCKKQSGEPKPAESLRRTMSSSHFRQITESRWFNNLILGVILAAGVLVGIETSHPAGTPWRALLERADLLILLIFTAEFGLKILAEGKKPWNYFRDPWNVFDFLIVAVCWLAYILPDINAGYVAVIRLARVLRVMRLVQALPQLKMLINAMLKSIPSMGYVGVLLLLLYYIYGAMGVFVFGQKRPASLWLPGHGHAFLVPNQHPGRLVRNHVCQHVWLR